MNSEVFIVWLARVGSLPEAAVRMVAEELGYVEPPDSRRPLVELEREHITAKPDLFLRT